jgi:hypothetical protein
MRRSHSSRAATSQTSTVQTVLPLRDQQRSVDRQRRVVPQPVSGAGGIAAGDADPVVEPAEAAGPSKRETTVCARLTKGCAARSPFVFLHWKNMDEGDGVQPCPTGMSLIRHLECLCELHFQTKSRRDG